MLIKLKVRTEAKKEKIEPRSKDHFDVWVKEKAQNNEANNKVLKLLGEYLGVNHESIRIIKGHTSPSKIVKIR